MVSALSYWGLVRSLDQADDRLLADKVRVIRAVLLNRPHDDQVLRQEVEEAWEARRDTQVYVRVVDADRRVMAETPEMGRVLPSTAFGPAEESEQAYDYASDTRTFRVLAARLVSDDRVESPVIVQVGTDRSGEFALLASYRRYLLVALVGGLILSSVIAHQIARRGMRPVHDITDTARRIRATNLHERLAVEGLPDELLALAGTFNQMLERLEE
jgi:two-component system heavy metal sensor histidine kinase CusS